MSHKLQDSAAVLEKDYIKTEFMDPSLPASIQSLNNVSIQPSGHFKSDQQLSTLSLGSLN